MRLYSYMMSSSTGGKGLFFDEPAAEIRFMMKEEFMAAEFVPFNSNPAEFRWLLFNREGDCLAAKLGRGNVHRAEEVERRRG